MYSVPVSHVANNFLIAVHPDFNEVNAGKNKTLNTSKGISYKFKSTWRSIAVGVLLLFTFSKSEAQQETNYAVHANIIYHFTKYINWPRSPRNEDFVIGIIGDSPLYDELKKSMTNKTAFGRRIVVTKVSRSAESYSCQIIFVSEEENGIMKKLAVKTAGTPVLLVSESEGLAEKGSCINFAIVSEHVTLEINKRNIEQRGLGIASELLKLGKIIR